MNLEKEPLKCRLMQPKMVAGKAVPLKTKIAQLLPLASRRDRRAIMRDAIKKHEKQGG